MLTGALCILAGLGKGGFVAELFSKPVRIGYLNGLALTILFVQLPKLLGVSTESHTLIGALRSLEHRIDDTDAAALALGASALALILLLRRLSPQFPGVLAAVILSTVAVAVMELSVPVVGRLPGGLPTPGLPHSGALSLSELAGAAVAIAFVAFADTSVLSRSYAGRLRQDVDQNQELAALGAANAAAGLLPGIPDLEQLVPNAGGGVRRVEDPGSPASSGR